MRYFAQDQVFAFSVSKALILIKRMTLYFSMARCAAGE